MKKLQKGFDYIIKYYGEDNCIPPRQNGIPVDLRRYM